MSMTDPISDMLTRIRNAISVNKTVVLVPYSKLKETLIKVLVSEKFVDKVEIVEVAKIKHLKITLCDEVESPRITEIKRISTPGRRYYTSASEMPRILRGRGIVVVSTSKGLMTGDAARKQKLGGEVMCSVY